MTGLQPFLNTAGGDELRLSEESVYGFCKKICRECQDEHPTSGKIEILKRRRMGIMENIRKLFMGAPAIF